MAKKKGAKASPEMAESGHSMPPSSDRSDRNVDRPPEVQAAEEAVVRAEAELEKAKELYHQVRQQATDQLKRVREMTVDELVDTTLKLVQEHPGPGVVIAALIGFFLGRLFRW